MEATAVYQISLIAAFIAGMVALFAPCCISYLFPAYIGNVFKEKRHVIFMTLIYSLGIFVVMMPVVLGAKALQMVFFRLHDQTYLFGGLFMLVVAGLSFFGVKLPMPHLHTTTTGAKRDVFSTFTLGVFAGITSACCAPVLIGVVALSTLTPTTAQALGVGAFYVLGMVTPLYLASLFIHKTDILSKPVLRKVVSRITVAGKTYPIFVSNIIAAVVFALTGLTMLWLTSTGRLGMTMAESAVTKSINGVALQVTELVGGIPGVDILFGLTGAYLLYLFIRQTFNKKKNNTIRTEYYCPMHKDVVSEKPGKCLKCGEMDLIERSVKKKGE